MIAPARRAAFEVLRALAFGQFDLGDALSRIRDPLKDPRDRALTTDLVLGTLRNRGAIDYQLQALSSKPLSRLDAPVLDSLRLAAYQIIYRERVPVSAVVNDAVSLVKTSRLRSAGPFANAVLRRLARDRDQLAWPTRPTAVAPDGWPALAEYFSIIYSHPPWLVSRWLRRYGEAAVEGWLQFNNQPPAVTLATNRLRTARELLATRLSAEDVDSAPTAIAPYGLTVISGQVLRTKAFREGYCLIQDEASQIIAELVEPEQGTPVFDVCASPGGKTIALAAQVGTAGFVVASDVRRRRVRLLRETLRRCQAGRVGAVQIPATGAFPFRDGTFERVLVDAPCSGLGTVRRDPDIRWRRTESDFPALSRQQGDLLSRASRLVAPGGCIIYSTCSSEPEENEEVIAAFLGKTADFVVKPVASLTRLGDAIRSLSTTEGFFRSQPGVGLEAFFGAVLERIR